MTFLLPSQTSSGTPFLSFFTPEQMMALANECGLNKVAFVSGNDLNRRYFSDRADGPRNSNSEQFLVATI